MLFHLSQKIVSVWSRENIIQQGREEAYVYGVQLLLSTVVNTCFIVLISLLCGRPFAWMLFLIGFVPLRITSGGFHAKTPLKCSLSFCCSFIICLMIVEKISDRGIVLATLINSIATIITTCFFSPIPASNKPLSNTERKRNRKLSIAIAITMLPIVLLLYFLNFTHFISLYITFGEIASSFFLCLGKVLLICERNDDTKQCESVYQECS